MNIMRVAIVTHGDLSSPSGGQIRMITFAKSFCALGHRTDFVTSAGIFRFDGTRRPRISYRENNVSIVNHLSYFISEGLLLSFRTYLAEADVVIVQLPFSMIRIISGLIRDLSFGRVCFDFSDTVATTNRHFLFQFAHKNLLRLGVRSIDKIVASSKRLSIEINDYVRATCFVIPNSVDTQVLFNPSKYNKSPITSRLGLDQKSDRMVLLYSGFVSRSKGADSIVRIAKKLSDSRKIGNYKFLIVGGGDYLDEMKGEVRALGLADSFLFIGQVSHEFVPEYMAISDIGLVMPSILDSGGALKVSEYLSMSLPVIAPNQDWFTEDVRNEVNGWVLDSKNFVDNVSDLLSNEINADRLRLNARNYATEKLDSRVLANEYLQILAT